MIGKFASATSLDVHRESSPGWTVSAGSLAAFAVAIAMATSSIVFSEPAFADVLMAGVIVLLPLLGAVRFGRMATLNLALWLIVVACGLAACSIATTMETAIPHQLVTLFLALGAFVLAGFVSADPVPRFRLIMICYVVGCLIATAAAVVGYFEVIPSAYDLFTNYGRARGTFKDPNVLGAALAPAIVYLVWVVLRKKPGTAILAAGSGLVLALGLLLTFSRGAWASTAVSVLLAVWMMTATTRRKRDVRRFAAVAAVGTLALAATLTAALHLEAVSTLFEERASLDQSYDEGPEGRFGGQAKARALILEHPFGIGTYTFRDTYHPEEAHNVYLTQFLNAGWLGGILYIASVAGTLAAGFYAARRRTALQGPLILATASLTGTALEGFVIDTDHWRHFFILMALIWGLVDAEQPLRASGRRSDD